MMVLPIKKGGFAIKNDGLTWFNHQRWGLTWSYHVVLCFTTRNGGFAIKNGGLVHGLINHPEMV